MIDIPIKKKQLKKYALPGGAVLGLVLILIATGWGLNQYASQSKVPCANTDPLRNPKLYDDYTKNNSDRFFIIYKNSMARNSNQTVKVYLSRVFITSNTKNATKIGEIIDKDWDSKDSNSKLYPKITIKGYGLKKATLTIEAPSKGEALKSTSQYKGATAQVTLNPTFKDAYNNAKTDILKAEYKQKANASSYFKVDMDNTKRDRPFEVYVTDTEDKEHLLQQFCVKVT